MNKTALYQLRIDSDLMKKAKMVCIEEDISFKALVVKLLTEYVDKYEIPSLEVKK